MHGSARAWVWRWVPPNLEYDSSSIGEPKQRYSARGLYVAPDRLAEVYTEEEDSDHDGSNRCWRDVADKEAPCVVIEPSGNRLID